MSGVFSPNRMIPARPPASAGLSQSGTVVPGNWASSTPYANRRASLVTPARYPNRHAIRRDRSSAVLIVLAVIVVALDDRLVLVRVVQVVRGPHLGPVEPLRVLSISGLSVLRLGLRRGLELSIRCGLAPRGSGFGLTRCRLGDAGYGSGPGWCRLLGCRRREDRLRGRRGGERERGGARPGRRRPIRTAYPRLPRPRRPQPRSRSPPRRPRSRSSRRRSRRYA